MAITDIFAKQGEAAFRNIEHHILNELLATKTENNITILATGGGTPLQPDNQALLKAAGPVIWLDINIDTALQRTRGNKRPLLIGQNRRAVLNKLMQDRCPTYQALATWTINANQPSHQVVKDILAKILPKQDDSTITQF